MKALRIQRRVWVQGKVQGVGFRAATAREASRFPAVQGFVRNLPDGRVEAFFSGPEDEVLHLVAWSASGPPGARVDAIEVHEENHGSETAGGEEPGGADKKDALFAGFRVERDGY